MQTPGPTGKAKAPYKLGFCLSGAATGGAYSAGVMDFLLEALTAWDAEKQKPNRDPSIPMWDVAVTELIGTSAGGINSTLTVNALNTDHEPLPRGYKLSDGKPKNNSLFNVWANEATYRKVLNTDDLDRQDEFNTVVSSFLNADFMKDTVSKVLSPPVIHSTVPAWASDLHLSLTTTNLRGVPYSVENFVDKLGGARKYHMRKYADYTQFHVAVDPSKIPESEMRKDRIINLGAARTDASWVSAVDSARATAAFPVGFPSVTVRTPRAEYEDRMDLPPDWAEDYQTSDEEVEKYAYAALDGAVCNNTPFGLLIDNMEGRNGGKTMQKLPKDAWGSVILVDPFPSSQHDPKLVREGIPIVETIMSLFTAARGEASFKEDEIVAALSDKSMDKFMIAPKTISDPSQTKHLATGELHSFAGILDPSIPHHDFVLGRKNCQYFLQNVFVMKRSDAEQNDIFKGHLENISGDVIPIIPVVGSAKEHIPQAQWPSFSEREKEDVIENVMKCVDERMQKVLHAYMVNLGIIKNYDSLGAFEKLGQFGTRRAAQLIESLLRARLRSMAEDEVRKAMDQYR